MGSKSKPSKQSRKLTKQELGFLAGGTILGASVVGLPVAYFHVTRKKAPAVNMSTQTLLVNKPLTIPKHKSEALRPASFLLGEGVKFAMAKNAGEVNLNYLKRHYNLTCEDVKKLKTWVKRNGTWETSLEDPLPLLARGERLEALETLVELCRQSNIPLPGLSSTHLLGSQ